MTFNIETFRQFNGRQNTGRGNMNAGRNNTYSNRNNNRDNKVKYIGTNNSNNKIMGRDNMNNHIMNRTHNKDLNNRRFDRGNIGNHNFGGMRRERPFTGSGIRPYRHNINNNNFINNQTDGDLNLAYYNPYAYLHPLYDGDGNLQVYNTVYNLDNTCLKECAETCVKKGFTCLNNCYDTCSFDETRGLDGDSIEFKESFNNNYKKHLYALLVVIVLFIIVFVFTKK